VRELAALLHERNRALNFDSFSPKPQAKGDVTEAEYDVFTL